MYPVERQHDQHCTPAGVPLTAIDGDSVIEQDIAQGNYGVPVLGDPRRVWVAVYWASARCAWYWSVTGHCDHVDQVGGTVTYADHRNARDVAIDRATRAVALLGTEP